jgi:arginyl-tRNA synthetase
MSLTALITQRFQAAIARAFGEEFLDTDPIIKATPRADLGDYQANFAMGLAKKLRLNPREVATQTAEKLQSEDLFGKVEIAGPGFINLFLKPDFLNDQLTQLLSDPNNGISTHEPQTVVIDYGSPNVAKEMHVGHLRSTIIGDSLARVLSLLGHQVIRQNHLGDWGTQFGMLIQEILETNPLQQSESSMSHLNAIYQAAKLHYDSDPEFAKRARERVVSLQKGDQETVTIWKKLVAESQQYFNQIYQRLHVLLTDADIKSESAYNPMLSDIVAELLASGLATHSEGAIVIFLEGFQDKEGNPTPMIIQKSDGGHLYATTDLAAAKYRLKTLKATRIIYVIDSRQSQHMAMLFSAVRKQGWVNPTVQLEHASFGSILGPDRKPFKTRSGETIKLVDLLNEAEQRAAAILTEKKTDLPTELQQEIVRTISMGAIKYSDLCSERVKDYIFDWDRMLSFDGNSAPYLLNAYVRIQAIFRKAASQGIVNQDLGQIQLKEAIEHQLGLKLLAFPDVVESVAKELAPHHLCHYLCELATCFHSFYEHCPILRSDVLSTERDSRLLLCHITAKILQQGLDLLGIQTIYRM